MAAAARANAPPFLPPPLRPPPSSPNPGGKGRLSLLALELLGHLLEHREQPVKLVLLRVVGRRLPVHVLGVEICAPLEEELADLHVPELRREDQRRALLALYERLVYVDLAAIVQQLDHVPVVLLDGVAQGRPSVLCVCIDLAPVGYKQTQDVGLGTLARNVNRSNTKSTLLLVNAVGIPSMIKSPHNFFSCLLLYGFEQLYSWILFWRGHVLPSGRFERITGCVGVRLKVGL
mmetsp:Transcript_20338/g.48447  ORF Transcript_20338/g.48447 Transcript_20338/m.48447 type:complete len:233 (+) Transcript_20338:289-987(+)